MNAKENFLHAIYFQNPDYVPMTNEGIWYVFSFNDIVKRKNWTDNGELNGNLK
jgi:hypothetical protein